MTITNLLCTGDSLEFPVVKEWLRVSQPMSRLLFSEDVAHKCGLSRRMELCVVIIGLINTDIHEIFSSKLPLCCRWIDVSAMQSRQSGHPGAACSISGQAYPAYWRTEQSVHVAKIETRMGTLTTFPAMFTISCIYYKTWPTGGNATGNWTLGLQ